MPYVKVKILSHRIDTLESRPKKFPALTLFSNGDVALLTNTRLAIILGNVRVPYRDIVYYGEMENTIHAPSILRNNEIVSPIRVAFEQCLCHWNWNKDISEHRFRGEPFPHAGSWARENTGDRAARKVEVRLCNLEPADVSVRNRFWRKDGRFKSPGTYLGFHRNFDNTLVRVAFGTGFEKSIRFRVRENSTYAYRAVHPIWAADGGYGSMYQPAERVVLEIRIREDA